VFFDISPNPSALGREHPSSYPKPLGADRLSCLRHSRLGTKGPPHYMAPYITGPFITPGGVEVVFGDGVSPSTGDRETLCVLSKALRFWRVNLYMYSFCFSPCASVIIFHLHFACYNCTNGITTSAAKIISLS